MHICWDRKKFCIGAYTSGNTLCEKVVWQANGRRLSAENFDRENVDKLIKFCQIHQYFPRQNLAPYGISYIMISYQSEVKPRMSVNN